MFPNKQALLDDLATRVLRVIEVTKQDDAVSEAAGVSPYTANVLNMESGNVSKSNILFYVLDEGTEQESAYYANSAAGSKISLETEAVAYLRTLPYTKVQVQEVDSRNEFIIVRAFRPSKLDASKAEEVRVMIYKDGDNPAHKELA